MTIIRQYINISTTLIFYVNVINMKYCPKCKTTKYNDNFYHSHVTKDKLYGLCKECHSKAVCEISKRKSFNNTKQEWEEKKPKCLYCNKDITLEKFYLGGRGLRPKYCSRKCFEHQYRKDNYDRVRETQRKSNKKRYIKKRQILKNKQCVKCNIEFQTYNLQQLYCSERCKINVYRSKKYKTDILYKLKLSLRGRIGVALRKTLKSNSTMKLVGCTLPELKQYLENKFQIGMSWENHSYRGWHIDHIIPCASFDLSKQEEQKKCFHYTNLQPLWGKDNIRKSAKIL